MRVKSFSVGDGDMFYIKHGSDNFTVIDCCLYHEEGIADAILDEIEEQSSDKTIKRFISTHPDDDHIDGLTDFDNRFGIVNFYCVNNAATKTKDSDDFDRYCKLRGGDKHFYLYEGCRRRWMNLSNEERKSAGLKCYWPITTNKKFKEALKKATKGESPNNISPAIRYSCECGASFLWMGDMETDMQQEMYDCDVKIPATKVLFAAHHGRASGKVPSDFLSSLSPQLIVIGEAPSKDLDYYSGYNTITQNTAGDILFEIDDKYIDVFVGNSLYDKKVLQTRNNHVEIDDDMTYWGSIKL